MNGIESQVKCFYKIVKMVLANATVFGCNGGAMFGCNGRAMFGFNSGAMFGFNSGAVFGFNSGAVFGCNGRAVFGCNGRAVFGFNGGAVSLDSQGCKPLEAPPTCTGNRGAMALVRPADTPLPQNPVLARSPTPAMPTIPSLRDSQAPSIFTRGSHPWLSNAIAPRFNTPSNDN